MTKGKYGIYLWFYAFLAFVLVALGQTTLCALLLGFVIVAENNEWLTKQVIQAFSLSLVATVLNRVIDWIGTTLNNLLGGLHHMVGNIISVVFDVFGGLVTLLVLALVVWAIIKVVKEKDAKLPGLSILANKAFDIAKKEEK